MEITQANVVRSVLGDLTIIDPDHVDFGAGTVDWKRAKKDFTDLIDSYTEQRKQVIKFWDDKIAAMQNRYILATQIERLEALDNGSDL